MCPDTPIALPSTETCVLSALTRLIDTNVKPDNPRRLLRFSGLHALRSVLLLLQEGIIHQRLTG